MAAESSWNMPAGELMKGKKGLVMGMSDDYETAVRFGATHVRIGSALFGGRPGA